MSHRDIADASPVTGEIATLTTAPSEVDVLIVSYKCRDEIANCLESIRRHAPDPHDVDLRVHVWDNASGDGTCEMIRERFPDVELVASDVNRGFAAANNALAEMAAGEYLLLLNPDTVWRSDVVTPLVRVLRSASDAVLVAPRLVSPDGHEQLSSQRFPTLRYELARALTGTKLRRVPGIFDAHATIDAVQGVHLGLRTGVHESQFLWATCWMIRARWVSENGLFDERLPLYDEDLELCLRVARTGSKILYAPEVELLHIGGSSSDPDRKRALMEGARSRYYAVTRGRLAALAYRDVVMPIDRLRRERQSVTTPTDQSAPAESTMTDLQRIPGSTLETADRVDDGVVRRPAATDLAASPAATDPATPPAKTDLPARPRMAMWRGVAALAIAAFVIAAGLVTYVVAGQVTPEYSASSQIAVNVAGSTGLGEDSVVASNDLTAQYVQLLTTSAVLAAPARALGTSIPRLQSQVSAGSVAQQNLLQITAHASSPASAQRIARVVTAKFSTYLARSNRRASRSYTRALSAQLRGVDDQIDAVSRSLAGAGGSGASSTAGSGAATTPTGGQTASLTTQLGSLLAEQETLRGDIAEHTVASAVDVRTVVPVGGATKVAPKPKLYAIVAALIALFVGLQVAFLGDRRRRSRRS